MRILRLASCLLLAALAGCGGSGEIPLAKVPPPPAGFGQATQVKGAPRAGSPTNASELTK